MKTLVIKGHPTRGKEVIETLEMLGGKNEGGLNGKSRGFYFIGCNNNIDIVSQSQTNFMIFDLEEFLEKYPYKIGDMVQSKGSTSCRSIYRIEKMIWKNNQIHYVVYNPWQEYDKCTITTEYLRPYKEELKQERKYPELRMDPSDDDKLATEVVIGNDKILPPNGYLIGKITEVDNGLLVEFAKKQSQYPKTYDECYEIMNIPENKLIQCGTYGYKAGLLSNFQQLLICRDAYWKIIGEEMGFSGPWAPDYTNTNKLEMHYIYCTANEISYGQAIYPTNKILIFPTRKLCDTFLENFKSLIEKCKEFL